MANLTPREERKALEAPAAAIGNNTPADKPMLNTAQRMLKAPPGPMIGSADQKGPTNMAIFRGAETMGRFNGRTPGKRRSKLR
jgi:hypothetical protein